MTCPLDHDQPGFAVPNTIQTELPSTGFIRLPEVLRLIPVGRSTWWLGVKRGRYPAPVKLGPRITAWRVEEIRELIAQGR